MSAPARAARILIVDDELTVGRLLKLNLEDLGYEVRVESCGARCVAAARRFRPHAVLLDLVMPDLSGADVARELEADAELCGTPVIFFSAMAAPDRAIGGEVPGRFRQVLSKPIRTRELVECLERALASRPFRRMPGPSASHAGGAPACVSS